MVAHGWTLQCEPWQGAWHQLQQVSQGGTDWAENKFPGKCSYLFTEGSAVRVQTSFLLKKRTFHLSVKAVFMQPLVTTAALVTKTKPVPGLDSCPCGCLSQEQGAASRAGKPAPLLHLLLQEAVVAPTKCLYK